MKKIPDNAKKVFEGTIFDVYQWENTFDSGKTSLFEAMRRIGSTRIIPVVDNKILLVEEEGLDGMIEVIPPGGRLERGESSLVAARRELLEETGYSGEEWVHWFDKDLCESNKMEWVTSYFIAKNCSKDANHKNEEGEKITVKLLDFEEFLASRNKLGSLYDELKIILEKVANSEVEKQKLKDLLGITT